MISYLIHPYCHHRFRCRIVSAAAISRTSPLRKALRADQLWQSIDRIPAAPANARIGIRPTKFQAFTVNADGLAVRPYRRRQRSYQPSDAKRPSRPAALSPGLEITLPKPDGTFARFQIEEVALMEPALAAKFPGIKTYRGRGLDDPMASLQLDVNPWTLHAQVLSPSGIYYIDPYWKHDGSVYMSYAKSDLTAGGRQFKCLVENENTKRRSSRRTSPQLRLG